VEKDKYKLKYVQFNVGDIVKEKYWISTEPNSCLYGIILSVIREGYIDVDWIEGSADQVEIYWFQWRSTEILPSCFIDMISTINGVTREEEIK
jgi:hypothetical protein|tara:strand:- start:4499 stop:4777 length:279 start_codon:yes stop_codon:yes gene_type:complete